jgi:catechol 2,3-dioxygenase
MWSRSKSLVSASFRTRLSDMAEYSLTFSHMGFLVRDLDKMVAFYCDVLGFFQTDKGLLGPVELRFLSRDPTEHHQIVLKSGRGEDQATTIDQISLRVGSLDELRTVYARLVAAGTANLDPATHGNAWSVYFPDPEGNRIEVYTDSEFYVSQPCKVKVDLSRPAEDLRAENEAMCRTLTGFKPINEWHADMRALMGIE